MIEFLSGKDVPKDDNYLIIVPDNFVYEMPNLQMKLNVSYPSWEVKNFSDADEDDDKFRIWRNELNFIHKAIDEALTKTLAENAFFTDDTVSRFLLRLKCILNTCMISYNHWTIYHQIKG